MKENEFENRISMLLKDAEKVNSFQSPESAHSAFESWYGSVLSFLNRNNFDDDTIEEWKSLGFSPFNTESYDYRELWESFKFMLNNRIEWLKNLTI